MKLALFGPGYTGARLAAAFPGSVTRVSRADFDTADLSGVTHILSTIPPAPDGDPVLARHGDAIRTRGAQWIGYLSSTGVYGDTGGAWVDESAPIGRGRRSARSDADLAWQALSPSVHIFRLPGIYGPGRSPFDRPIAFRVDAPAHLFSRIHVDDIVGAVLASMRAPAPGIYNLADTEPAASADVAAYAARLSGREPAPLVALADAPLSEPARGFYSERRRVTAAKMTRVLGYRLRYPDYRTGLRAIWAEAGR